jgi:hypothetical protein
MKKYLLFFVFGVLLVPSLTLGANTEVSITSDGSATIFGAKVMQLAGGTFFMRMYWGEAYVRFVVKTNSKTKILRGTGEATNISEIKEGDTLDIRGVLESGSDTLNIIAGSIKNSSVQKKQSSFSGKVISIDLSSNQFTLNSKTDGQITIHTNGSTVFKKGGRELDLEHLKIGDTITKTYGDYNLTTKTLEATNVVTFIDPTFYKPQNFEGKLKSVEGLVAPTQIVLSISGIDYTINIASNTSVLSKNRSTALLNRFVAGDTIRIYGTREEIDAPVIDAEIVRNINL